MSEVAPSKLLAGDVWRVATIGLHTRRMRAVLSAVGIAIGIASMVAVLGISESSKAELISTLDELGTNLLTVSPGQSLFGEASELPPTANRMLLRVEGIEAVTAVEDVDATVRPTPYTPEGETGGIAVRAADLSLPQTLGATIGQGRFLDETSDAYTVVVLGAIAAERLGIESWFPGLQVWLDGRWFTVAGILDTVTLAPEIDRSALIGNETARKLFEADGSATTIYVRAAPEALDAARELLPAAANPERPEEVEISRPSDAIAAKAAAKSAFTALFLGLGAVALLVGGIGIANVMVISVLERRSEVGLRRALGATRRHIRIQFLTESLLLASIGGGAGVGLGAAITYGYALSRGWATVVPVPAFAGGLAAALAIGAVAGLYPAMRAARLAPTEALRTV